MSLKQRFRNMAAAFLMVLSTIAPMGGVLTRSVYAADGEPDLGVPGHGKTLTPNLNAEGKPDGTYTITLSVTGKAESTTVDTGANVVVVMDTSGSMRFFLESNTGQYGTYDTTTPASIDNYYRANADLYSNSRCSNSNRITNNTTSGTVYYHPATYDEFWQRWNVDERQCLQYTGQRYDSSKTRLDSAKSSLSSLFTTLLANNTAEHPSLVEISFITFSDSTNLRNSWVTTSTPLTNSLNSVSADGSTNWNSALNLAKTTLDGKRDGDKGYVIFMSDGNPTTYPGCSGNSCGKETDAQITTSYNSAAPKALAITNAGYNLYDLGVYGNVDRMSNLTTYANTATSEGHGDAYYYAAQNETAVNAAFADIVNSITNNLSLTNIEYSDGITGLTTMSVNGTAGNFKYTLGGVETTDPQIATATYENNQVVWNLGDYVLENGVTATVSFTVWPSQEAYDLVADLNNGKREYDSLSETEKGSVSCTFDSDGKVKNCTLKTNTDYPMLQYQTVKNSSDGSEPVYGKVQRIPLTNPEPVGLDTQKLDIVKLWEDGLDPSQQDDYKNEVILDLYRKENGTWNKYEENIHVSKDTNEYVQRWVADKKVAVAPGIMLSENSDTGKLVKDSYPVVDGYVILEEGHDYELREQGTTSHYYLTNYQYHPMLVDGVIKNVFFERNGTEIVSVVVMDNISELSATNTLKGGITVKKEVSGREDVSKELFTISTIFEDESVEHTYRVYYGPYHPCTLNPTDDCKDERGRTDRSKKQTVTGTFTMDYYVGDEVRFIDVDTGTKFKVEENTDNLTLGYSFDTVEHKITHNSQNNYVDYVNTEIDGEWHIVQKNASSLATVKNVYDATTLKISKTIDVIHGDRDAIKAKTFDFKVTLKDGDEELAGEYSYTTNKNNSGKIVSGGTITLGDGEIATIADLPVGAGYIVEEQGANDNGFTTTVSGEESGTLVKAGATVAYTNTYNATPTSTQIIALKSFNDWTSDDVFYFTLKENGNQIGTPVPVSAPVSLETNKQATFDVTYTDPGTYTYTIEESTNGFSDRNITSTPNVLTVTVVVVDNEDGTLSIAQGYPMFTGDGENNNTITNTYESTGSLQLYASKILTGRDWKEGDVFTFQLFAKDGETETQLGENVTIDYAHRNDNIAFSTINYETGDTGTRVYVIREVTDNLPAGVTAQTGAVTVNVTLTDNHNGSITTNFDADEYIAQLENVYTTKPSDPTEAVLDIAKTITDRTNSKKDGDFTFQLQNMDGSKVQEKVVSTNNLTGTGAFNGISFTEAGTYNYKIVEIAGTTAGFTYDETVHNVVIVVKDDTDKAQLYVDSIKIDNQDTTTATFTNIYEADANDAKVKFDITKTLTGFEGETPATFTFNMTGDATDMQTIQGSGSASFKELTYTEAGKHTYTIREQKDSAAGYTYDETVYTVTVDVVDENAKLVPKVEIKKGENVVSDITFENTYSASGDTQLQITKAFAGDARDWSGESFEFELTGDGIEEAMTATADADSDWVAVFDTINYENAGEYKYTITEKDSGLKNVVASDPIEVTVNVIDNGNGTLTATPSYTNNATITNTYTTTSTTAKLHVDKKIDDQSLSGVDGDFDFTLSGDDYSSTVTVTTNNGEGGADFDEIEFTAAGIYNFTLKEVAGNEAGYTYDEKEYPVVIVVEDNYETAQLEVKSIKIDDKDATSITITNVYKATAATYEIVVKKTLNGLADGLEPAVFTFELVGDATDTKTISGAGETTFGPFTYDTTGTYNYTITETKGSAGGYSYDGASYTIEVKVEDEGGKLAATPTIKKDGDSATSVEFVNTYEAKGSVELSVTKDLQGRQWLDSDKFEFTLYGPDGNAIGEPVTVDKDNQIATFTVDYTEADHNQTYEYKISETGTLPAGFKKPDDITATVKVTDNGDGTMKTEVTDGGQFTMVNTYNTTATDITLHVNKAIEDISKSDANGTFEFTLSGNGYSDTVSVETEGGTGSADFKAIEFTEAGTYAYTLKEVDGGLTGFDYDEKEYQVVIVVEDNYDTAQLEVKSVKIDGDDAKDNSVTITNTYEAEPVAYQIEVVKTLNGMNEGVEPVTFEFELTGDGIEEPQILKINGAGSGKFDEITYTETGLYMYQVREIDNSLPGYLYDAAVFIIRVTVDDEDGKLVARAFIDRDTAGNSVNGINFVNTYEAKPVEDYEISVVKELEGRDLKEGEFSFTLYDAEGNEVLTVLNDEDGVVTFDGLTFDKPGTYTFTVKENIDENKGDIEYDTNEYTITIVVKDDGEGSLYVESDDSAEVVFNNKWNEPGHGEDLPPSPNTEDDIVNSIALFSMSVIGLIGAIIFGKRKATEEE